MTVHIAAHDQAWAQTFATEAHSLKAAVPLNFIALHHIGSTAIPGILAKPIIDILGVVSSLDRFDAVSGHIEALGYQAMGAYGIDGRRYFRKTDRHGRRTHHLHIFETGSPHIERHLAFRDFLRTYAEKAAEYSALKSSLIESGVPYQEGKTEFVINTLAEAIDWYRGAMC